MNNYRMFAAAIAILTAIMFVGFGLATTTYSAITSSSSNDVEYDGNTIDILDQNDDILGNTISIARPVTSNIDAGLSELYPDETGNVLKVYDSESADGKKVTTIAGYKLRAHVPNGSPFVRCYVHMADARSWAIIDSITLNINGNDYNIGLSVNDPNSQTPAGISSIPSAVINNLSSDVEYSFTVTITYVNESFILYKIPQEVNGETQYTYEDTDFINLAGSTLVFVVGDSDPLST